MTQPTHRLTRDLLDLFDDGSVETLRRLWLWLGEHQDRRARIRRMHQQYARRHK